MINLLIAKNIIPFIVGVIISTSSILGLQHLMKQPITLTCPEPIISLKCPEQKNQSNTIDIEKLKAARGKITIQQHYHYELNSDTLLITKIRDTIAHELNKLRIAKCK